MCDRELVTVVCEGKLASPTAAARRKNRVGGAPQAGISLDPICL